MKPTNQCRSIWKTIETQLFYRMKFSSRQKQAANYCCLNIDNIESENKEDEKNKENFCPNF